MKPLSSYKIQSFKDFQDIEWFIKAEVNFWYSYVHFGLLSQIQGHSRKHQRHYQRKFCSWYSRLKSFRSTHAEHLI